MRWSPRLLDRVSVTARIVTIVLGVGLGLAARGTPEAVFDTDLLRVAGELALILALVVDAARIDFAALRRTAVSRPPARHRLPLTIAVGTIVAILLLPEICRCWTRSSSQHCWRRPMPHWVPLSSTVRWCRAVSARHSTSNPPTTAS